MRACSLIVVMIFVCGCAYSPQQINVQPMVSLEGDRYGKSRGLVVIVDDQRGSKVLGSRGGAYPDSSVITINNNLIDALQRAAEAKLAAQGFNIHGSSVGRAQLKVIVDEIQYQVTSQLWAKKILLNAVLRVEVSHLGETYTGRYQTRSEHQLLLTPSQRANEEMIDELLSATLTRLFADKKMQAFLRNI